MTQPPGGDANRSRGGPRKSDGDERAGSAPRLRRAPNGPGGTNTPAVIVARGREAERELAASGEPEG